MLLRERMLINRGRKVRGKESGFLCSASQPDTHTLTHTHACTVDSKHNKDVTNVFLYF